MPNKPLFSKPTASNLTKEVIDRLDMQEKAPASNLLEENVDGISKHIEAAAQQDINDSENVGEQETRQEEVKVETKVNLDDLNEATLLKYPIIAKALNDAPMAIIKPKTSDIVFHWVFYDRNATGQTARVVAQNVQRYRFWGFEFATLDDIEVGEEALADGMVDSGQIINYDTVLMKINKVRLMAHYKNNLIQSLEMTNKALARAIRAAEHDVKTTQGFRKAMEIHPQARIDFFTPTADSGS